MKMFWERALEVASRTTHPVAIVGLGLVLVVMVLMSPFKGKRPNFHWFLVVIVFLLSIVPLLLSAHSARVGIYHIRVVVLGTDGQPINQAVPTSSAGGELKQGNGNWEFDLPPQAKPSSGQITFYASVKDAYLSGNSTLELKEDYYPTVTVQLSPLPPTTIRGTVTDENGKSISGVRVSVSGFPEIAVTDEMENFSLPSHRAEGQSFSIRAEKGDRVAEVLAIAGRDIRIVLRRH